MPFDPSTLCARTTAGEAELATATQGLTLGQRRVLTLLESPAAVEELAEKFHLEPEKLARDLTRLAELKLVRLQGPGIETPAPDVKRATPSTSTMAPVVIGPGSRRSPVLPLAAGAVAILLGVGVWLGTRTHPNPPSPTAAQPVAATPAAPAGTGAAAPVANAGMDATPAVATVLRGRAPVPETRPEIRPGLASPTVPPLSAPTAPARGQAAAPPSTPTPPPVPAPATTSAPVAEGKPAPDRGTAAAAPPPTTAATSAAAAPLPAASPPSASAPAPVPVATTAPANAPPAAARGASETPPPLQVASLAPVPVAARPTLSSELKAISREPPDFPREAEGLKSGVVNARIHVDARGGVTSVDILGSQPPKVFDKAARRALLRWQFEPPASGQPVNLDVDVKFQRD